MKPHLLLILAFTGCATFSQFKADPNTAKAIGSLEQGVVAYLSGNTPAAAVDGISAAALLIRALQGTPKAVSVPAITQAVTSAGVEPKVATMVAGAVLTAYAQGQSSSVANESAALALDQAAAKFYP